MIKESILNRSVIKKKISLLLPDLRGGGAERVYLNLAEHFFKLGYHVEFILMQTKGELLANVPNGVRVVDLEANRIRNVLIPLVRYLRQSKPDVLLIGMWPLTIIGTLAYRLARLTGNLVIGDHSHLSASKGSDSWIKRICLRTTMRLVYPLADTRLAVSRGVAEDLSRLSGLPQHKFKVIYNPVVKKSFAGSSKISFWGNIKGKRILAVGSLKEVKDYTTLIHAFLLLKNNIESTLVILGEGHLRSDIMDLIKSLGLSDSVLMPGFFADTAPWYRDADLFVLSSKWEGFGNVIVEALAQGTTVVSTDCPSGPREILEEGRYGKLVPVGDVDALACAMFEALHKTSDPDTLKARAADFSVDRIAKQYLEVLFPEQGTAVEK